MASNYYQFVGENMPQTVEDAALDGPWTHRITLYCENPSAEFLEELNKRDGVVGVFIKEKIVDPDKKEAPSNVK
jgi:hypothetical protein